MATYEDFLAYVAPAVPGAPEPLIIQKIRDTCIDFCVETNMFQQTLEPIPSIANIAEYTIETPEDTKVALVMQAWYDSQKINVVVQSEASVNAMTVQYGIDPVPGTPKRIIYTGNDGIILDPVPDTGDLDIVLSASLKPSRTSTTVWDQMFEDFAEVIADGAMSKLMDIKGTVFYDPQESILKNAKFKAGVNRGMVRANQGNLGRKSMRVRYRRI